MFGQQTQTKKESGHRHTHKLPPAPVEPQNSTPAVRRLHFELDVHNDTIAVSVAPSDSLEVRRYGILGGTHEYVQRPKIGARIPLDAS